ncbi:hypothetical protein WR25_24731 [Diploscapter pachys]|uniref:RNA polymerase II subunit A C-terminal domain phosphatase n=1 Tax=Diploscapter pachys TaxID=2018661 RepID=A0A2A2L1T8_9BILA|nr:hypothetical protein WR25_24731 [Diploscapter pachys]
MSGKKPAHVSHSSHSHSEVNQDECKHEIIMKDMCAACGKDLRPKDGFVGQRSEPSTASVSMIHHVPELLISDTLAKEIGEADEVNLLNSRKLVLLVDLDQTIIHTTNRPFQHDPNKQADITRFTLCGSIYHTKLRPKTREFLERMATMFEMHIITYGQRQYAHKIADILDPQHKLFGYRILSRDELFSATHKTRNLKALFPTGDNLVVIIDDRSDVWQYSPALIQIKPYRFFKEVGDINAPRGAREQALLPADIDEDAEHDTILDEISRVLTNIHRKYYELFQQSDQPLVKAPDKILDVKTVIAEERNQVLKGCVIVLSGIVPMNANLETSPVYQLAKQFGAKIVSEFSDDVTHVIGAKWGTNKVHQAVRNGMHAVTLQWLYACVERWMKVDEMEYKLTEESTPSSGKSLMSSKIVSELANIETIKRETLHDMEHEVDEALSEGDDDEESTKDEGESETEADTEEKEIASSSRKRKADTGRGNAEDGSKKSRKYIPEAEDQGGLEDLGDEENEGRQFGDDGDSEGEERDYGDEREEVIFRF